KNVFEAFKKWSQANPLSGVTDASITTSKNEEFGDFTVNVRSTKFGYVQTSVFDHDLAESNEWEELREMWTSFAALAPLPISLKTGDDEEPQVFSNYVDF